MQCDKCAEKIQKLEAEIERDNKEIQDQADQIEKLQNDSIIIRQNALRLHEEKFILEAELARLKKALNYALSHSL